jgi:hypothetical protein
MLGNDELSPVISVVALDNLLTLIGMGLMALEEMVSVLAA